MRRPFVSGLLSAVLPGAGQVYAGRKSRGAVIFGAAALLCVAALWVAAREGSALASTLLRPEFLTALFAANAAVLVFRLWSVADAYRVAAVTRRPPRTRAGRARAVAAFLLLACLTVAPHALAGWAIVTTADTLQSVFAEEEPRDVLGGSMTSPLDGGSGPTFLPDAAAGTDRSIGPRSPALRRRASSPAASSPGRGTVATTWAGGVGETTKGRWLNLLLVGGDAGYLRAGLRADTLLVVSIQVGTRRAAAFSIPRNLERVPLQGAAGRAYGRFPDLLNALYRFGRARPELFPGGRDPGATALKQTLSHLLGIPIHYYALVDLRGFVEMVDALGGVRVDVTERIVDETSPAFPGEPWTSIDLQPGPARLDGRQALSYSRSRWQSSDYRRMERQRCLLTSMADQLDPLRVLRSLPKLSKAAREYVSTDIPLSRLPDLVELVARINPWTSVGISFNPPRYETYSPDVEPFREIVRHVFLSTPRELRTQDGLRALAGACRST